MRVLLLALSTLWRQFVFVPAYSVGHLTPAPLPPTELNRKTITDPQSSLCVRLGFLFLFYSLFFSFSRRPLPVARV